MSLHCDCAHRFKSLQYDRDKSSCQHTHKSLSECRIWRTPQCKALTSKQECVLYASVGVSVHSRTQRKSDKVPLGHKQFCFFCCCFFLFVFLKSLLVFHARHAIITGLQGRNRQTLYLSDYSKFSNEAPCKAPDVQFLCLKC